MKTKHLIKDSSSKIHILSKDKTSLVYPDLTEPLSQADYEKWGMDSLTGYENEIDKVLIEMNESGVLEDGRVLRKVVNKNELNISYVGVPNNGNYTDITPRMTSDTTTIEGVTYISSADSITSASRRVWYAFDGNESTGWSSAFTKDAYIMLDLGENNLQKVKKIDLYKETTSVREFEIEVSIDGIEYEVVYSGAYLSSDEADLKECILDNNRKIRYIRINVINTFVYSVTIREIKIFIETTNTKTFIKSSNKIQVLSEGEWLDTGLSEPLIKEDFETYGMDDLSIVPSEKWDELDDEFEIITWTDDLESEKFIEINTDPFSPLERLNQEEEFEVLTWSDAHETVEKTAQGVEQAIDEGKLFSTTIEDFSVITGVTVS